VQLRLGQVLHQADHAISHVYFPDTCVISLLTLADKGKVLETGLVGAEGFAGVSLVLGVRRSSVKSIVQEAGGAMRISAARLSTIIASDPVLERRLSRYSHVAMTTAMQIVACDNGHVLQARLARWLLMLRDRMHGDVLQVTQALLGAMLGVRRVGVTEAAGDLQRRGLIQYRRGLIRIVDRRRLRAAACSCYESLRKLSSTP
jgi:CRP-like cAMP-binding protein